jgi:reticulon-4-interacting protein 1, mitochondrial
MSTTTTYKCLVYGNSSIKNDNSNDRTTITATVRSKVKSLPRAIPRNHVLIRVRAAGLNPVDAKNVIGDKLPSFLDFLSPRVVRGSTIGFEFSGQVVRDDSGYYQPGDAVFGTMPPFAGTLAEYVVAPNDQICHMPTNLSYAEAASLPLVGLTALQALSPYCRRDPTEEEDQGSKGHDNGNGSKAGDNDPDCCCESILIVGASGGTGHIAIQVAKALGIKEIMAVCSTPNVEFCRQLGATRVVDYTCLKTLRDFESSTAKRSVDIILDCVTSADVRDSQHDYPRKLLGLCKTKYIRLGGATKDWLFAGMERTLPITCFRNKEKLFWIRFPKSSGELKKLAQWCREGKIKPCISREVDFSPEAVQDALDEILCRRVQGKLVVKIAEGASDK